MSNNNPNKSQLVINLPDDLTIEQKNAAKQLVNAAAIYATTSFKTGQATTEQIEEEAKSIQAEAKNIQAEAKVVEQSKGIVNKNNLLNGQEVGNEPQNGGAKKPKRKSPAKKPKSKKSPAKKPKRKSPAKK
jgi:hypothetical protein